MNRTVIAILLFILCITGGIVFFSYSEVGAVGQLSGSDDDTTATANIDIEYLQGFNEDRDLPVLNENLRRLKTYTYGINTFTENYIDAYIPLFDNLTEDYVPKCDEDGYLVDSVFYEDQSGNIGVGMDSPSAKLDVNGDIFPSSDNVCYLGHNNDDGPQAWKGLILKDQAGTGKYYRVEVYNNALRIVDLTD